MLTEGEGWTSRPFLGPPWVVDEADLVSNGLGFPCFSSQKIQTHLLHFFAKLGKVGP